jgi:hypothetical protein
MSGKDAKIAALLADVPEVGVDRRYAGYFACFNRGLHYEAHDVLEALWLAGGRSSPNHAFHKGLIQLAGAFVHLGKGRRGPAVALLDLASANLVRYPARHERLDVAAVLALAAEWRARIVASGDLAETLRGHTPPRLELLPPD